MSRSFRDFFRRGDDQLVDIVFDLLASRRPDEMAKLSETNFRDEIAATLSQLSDDVQVKREAGIAGKGTRVDLYLHLQQHDFLITIKKGLSEQKIKNAIGETTIILDNWKPTVPGNKTYIILYAFGIKNKSELESIQPFFDFAERASNRDFAILFTTPTGGAEAEQEAHQQ